MKKTYSVLLFVAFTFGVLHAQNSPKQPIDYVNPMIGTGGNGAVTPVASVPFGMLQVGPDTRTGGSGYHYDDKKILGFSHFHKSGGGCSDYLDILFQPVSGFLWQDAPTYPSSNFAFGFDHADEKAKAGHYSVTLSEAKVQVSLTATARAAFHRYIFPEKGLNHVAIDLKHGATGGCTIVQADNYDTVKLAHIRIIDAYTIEGSRISEGQAKAAHAYFYAVFSKPIKVKTLFKNRQKTSEQDRLEGTDVRSILSFDTDGNNELLVKVGISSVSTEGAKQNLLAEIPHWNFETTKNQAQQAWNKVVSQIQVTGEDEKQKEIFYTSLYFTKMYPMLFADVDGQYRGADIAVHQAKSFNYYGGHIGFWDVYRTAYPLLTLTHPEVANDIIQTSLAYFKNYGQLPVLVVFGNETYQMTGLHIMPVIADCYFKGIRNYDAELLFRTMKSTALRDTTGFSMRYFTGLKNYKKYGYVPADLEMEATARTLDYAYDDWCIAQTAKLMGKKDDYQFFLNRSKSYQQVFDPSTGLMRGRLADGSFRTPFDPLLSSHRKDDFCEGNAWQWSFASAHDIKGLAKLMGGKEQLQKKLDTLFTLPSKTFGSEASGDISGLIGQYAHGNEPGHHTIYMYAYLGQPWKTQALVNKVLNTQYDNTPEGICGNDDTGQMSAWYVMSALGFYPVRHGDGTYVIGAPLFEKATMFLPKGKTVEITAKNLDKTNIYVQSVKLNGKPYTKAYFNHFELINNSKIEFTMGAEPNKKWASDDKAAPPSLFDELKK
jgi:predicted alpha-1,2-mannosidase